MSRRERSWALGYGFILALVLTIPYLLGYFAESWNWRFTGFVFAVEDGNSYIAKMLSGSAGAWIFRSPYSTMEQTGVLAYIPYLLIGKLAAGPGLHEQLVVLYHLFRIFMTPFGVYATYQFISNFVKDFRWRRWGTLMSTVGGGAGWVLVVMGKGFWLESFPMDWISPEWFGFLAYFGIPHLILARGLVLTSLTLYLSSPIESKRAWYSGGVIALAGLVHPLSMVTAFAIIAVHQFAIWIVTLLRRSWTTAKMWLLVVGKTAIIPLPLIIYFAIKFTTDPYLEAWTEQNRIYSPHPIHAFFAYGLVLIPAILGIRQILSSKRWTGLILVAWVAAFPIFAYLPHNLQRRLPDGIWVAWIILSSLGLTGLRKYSPKREFVWRVILTGLAIPTSLMLFVSAIKATTQSRIPMYRPSDEVTIFNWLNYEADVDSVVLSTFETGNAMPAWAPVTVVLGHGPETANNASIRSQVNSYYSGEMDEDEQIQFLMAKQVDYVFYGPKEREFGGFDILQSSNYELRIMVGEYQLFEVVARENDE